MAARNQRHGLAKASSSYPGSSARHNPLSLEKYSYRKFRNASCIRILILDPKDDQSMLQCSLEEVDLDENPEYEAVSYCWGQPGDKSSILCESRLLDVPTNLRDFLVTLRSSNTQYRLFADAICIDQANDAERTQQIKLMGSIYQKCRQCFYWLGLASTSHDALAADVLSKIAGEIQRERSRSLSGKIAVISSNAKPPDHLTRNQSEWSSLWFLYGNAWFERMWILQEVVLARNGTILLGQYQWNVDEFFAIANYLYDRRSDTALLTNHVGYLQCLKLAAARQYRREHNENGSFLQILQGARERDASDHRDKVFAVLGLCKHEDVLHFQPDYTHSVNAVYFRVAKYILMNYEKPLRLLSAAIIKRWFPVATNKMKGLPSWVPDWSERMILTDSLRKFENSKAWSAGGSSRPSIGFQTSFNIERLVLRGKIASTIASWKLSKSMNDVIDDYEKLAHGLQSQLSRGLHEGRQSSQDKAALEGLLWCTLSRETTDSEMLRLEGNLPPPECTVKHCVQARLETAPPRFRRDLEEWMLDRKLASTCDGKIGWAPYSTSQDDSVCIFQGSDLPYILRTEGNGTFSIVGSCHIPGLMHGEFADSNIVPWQDVILV